MPSAKQTAAQKKFKANIAKAKTEFKKSGNKKSWASCVKSAFKK